MSKTKEKQLFQVQNILETLLEATDHFSKLVKEKNLNQGIYIFSSIVEGTEAVMKMLHMIDEDFTQHTSKIEKSLVLIAQQLEQGRFIKISEIIQFSLRPQFVKLQQAFFDTMGDQRKDKKVSIGVFHSWANPREFYPEPRIEAMVKESEKQEAQLYFFTSDDVDFEQKQVSADTFQNNGWERVTVPFPDVINNVGAGRKSHVERKLRREIPFTSFHVGNKYTLPKRMVKYRKYAELLVPFRVCNNEAVIYDFLEKNNRVVFKYLGSNRGENIYFITKKGSRYVMLDQKKERILNEDAFKNWVQNTILAEKGSFIVQRYIHTRTKNDEPYHFRAHVQKNGEAKWQLTHIYPRIGNKKSNLSNIATEGRVEDFPTFLINEFGDKQGTEYKEKILQLSIDIAQHLDKLYGLSLDELGIDFAIDDTGRIWMHEANNGPQTAYHEEKRAVNTIAYAKYIAKNGVMYTDAASKVGMVKGQFKARMTDLPFENVNDRPLIGMLVGKQTNDPLTMALTKEAQQNDISFYYFTPKDIDFDYELIRGYIYEDAEWKTKVFEYPDAIIDRLKARGNKDAKLIYEELEDIPFTNEWPVQASSRSGIYELLSSSKEIAGILADYQKVDRPRKVFQFLEKYGKVLLKPEKASIHVVYSIEYVGGNDYVVTTRTSRKRYHEMQLRNFIKDLIKQRAYIAQRDLRIRNKEDELSNFHVHVMKGESNNWSLVSAYAEVQKIMEDNTMEVIKESITDYLSHSDLKEQLNILAIKTAIELEKISNVKISEVVLTFVMDQEGNVGLLEVDPGGPITVYDSELLASSMIMYAKSLIEKEAISSKI